MNRSPLNPFSVKRLAALAAEGNPRPYSTLTRAGARRVVAPVVRAPRDTGPDAATVKIVLGRDGRVCFRCGGACWGLRGRDWSVQHRRARGAGGSRRPDTNTPPNLILLCGHGTAGCHGWVEHNPAEADANGWAIPRLGKRSDPLIVPVVHYLHGVVYLTADGRYASRPEVAA